MASNLNCHSTQYSSSMALNFGTMWECRLPGSTSQSPTRGPGTGTRIRVSTKLFQVIPLCGGQGLYFGEFWAVHAFGPNQGSRVKETEGEFTAPDRRNIELYFRQQGTWSPRQNGDIHACKGWKTEAWLIRQGS